MLCLDKGAGYVTASPQYSAEDGVGFRVGSIERYRTSRRRFCRSHGLVEVHLLKSGGSPPSLGLKLAINHTSEFALRDICASRIGRAVNLAVLWPK